MLAPAQVTVCLVNRDGGEGFARCLAALPAEARAVVVDNASRDGSQVAATRRSYTRLLENPDNAGFARGCNQAAQHAAGEVLLFLNNDALLEGPALEALLASLAADPQAVAAGPRLLGERGPQPGSAGPAPRLGALLHRIRWLRWTGLFKAAHRRYRDGLPAAGPVERLGGAALAVRRRAFEAVGGFDEGYPFGLEDVDLSLRLGRLGRLLYVPAAEVLHAGGVSSARHRGFAYRGFELGFARYARLHLGVPAGWLYKLAATLDQPLRLVELALRAVLRRGERRRALAGQARAVLAFLPALPRLWWA